MTQVTFPKPGVNWTQPQWRTHHADDTGVVGSPGGAARQVFADGSGPYIKRLPGARYIQGIYAADDATWQGTVADNATSQWRIDRVVDQLGEDGVITTVIVPGTAATTPAPPDLEQTPGGLWQEHLAYFRVKPGFTNVTSSDAAVVDERRYMPARVVPIAAEAQRPAAPRVGDENVYSDGRRERWTGSAWVADVLNRVALFSDPAAYTAMTPGTVNTSSLLGTITLPGPSAILVRAFSALGFDVAGQAWTLAVGVRLTPTTTGTAQADYAGSAVVFSGVGASVACEALTPILAADTYQVRSYVRAVTGTTGNGVAFTNPRLTLETKRAL